MKSNLTLLKLILPEFLIDNFELVSVENFGEKLHLYLEEKIISPDELTSIEFVSKRFCQEVAIQYFPLKDKCIYLHIKRRRRIIKRKTNKKTPC